MYTLPERLPDGKTPHQESRDSARMLALAFAWTVLLLAMAAATCVW